MENSINSELERVRFEKIRHVSVFINSIVFRNMHEHGALELAIVLRGKGRIIRNHGHFCVKPGDIILYNFYEPHEIAADGVEPLSTLCIQISNRFCKDYFPKLPNLKFDTSHLAVLPAEDLQQIHDLTFGLAQDYFGEAAGYQLACIGKIGTLLAFLMSKLPYTVASDAEFTARQSKTARMRRVASYIDQHYKEKVTLEMLAEMEGITPTHLSHFFSEAFHVSFREYLNTVRLEKALVLLRDPSLYLVDICMESGFSDSRYLNVVFEKTFGCTVAKYRTKLLTTDSPGELTKGFITHANFRYDHQSCIQIVGDHIASGGFQY